MTLTKILIANRGEIACRIIRTANRMGIKCVAVYSDADKNSLHVKLADEAIYIGESAAQKSYLVKEKIISVAKQTKCQAIHPGYGFLSENFEFSEMCTHNGIIFIGAPWKAIRDMGIKSTSKAIMSAANVPIIGGYHETDQSIERLINEADRIGYPVMIKAIRGGGGKGMRIAFTRDEFLQQLNSAKSEALKSFNNDEMLIEKFVQKPRHVEVQVFGDQHGNYVYLFERDCSVQRRHQKVIEEAPAPGLTSETRRSIGEAAVKAAKAVDYVGAGTVEFIMDDKQNFFFMEMNTRLQVEHPITEMITNTDLVEWQLRVAGNEKLPLMQDNIKLNGHAFEARIYAEDPNNNFMPGAGQLKYLRTPAVNAYTRVETGVEHGDLVSVHYDPLIAKLVVWSNERRSALNKLKYALGNYHIGGLTTNIPFLMSLCEHKEFIAGNVHTDFIPMHRDELFNNNKTRIDEYAVCSAVCSIIDSELIESRKMSETIDSFISHSSNNFWPNSQKTRNITILFNDLNKKIAHDVTTLFPKNGASPTLFDLKFQNKTYKVELVDLDSKKREFYCDVNGHRVKFSYYRDPDAREQKFYSYLNDNSYEFEVKEPDFVKKLTGEETGDGAFQSNYSFSPMPGVVEKINVKEGDTVKRGDSMITMIAMKMEYVIKASRDGKVEKVHVNSGQNVNKGVKLITIGDS